MTWEAILASFHLLAVLTVVVFISSMAALCRVEWLNEAVVRRLSRLNLIYAMALLVLLISGLMRVLWGIKGTAWYVSQPLFHLKMLLFVLVILMALRPAVVIRQWRQVLACTGVLPDGRAVQGLRKWIMWQAHIIPVIAVVAVLWVRGM